jgi:hypothetical protein
MREISFIRLPEVDPSEIVAHMSDPRVAEHMPLLNFEWDDAAVAKFVATKEAFWNRDGLGHWAIMSDDEYVGWGGFPQPRPWRRPRRTAPIWRLAAIGKEST